MGLTQHGTRCLATESGMVESDAEAASSSAVDSEAPAPAAGDRGALAADAPLQDGEAVGLTDSSAAVDEPDDASSLPMDATMNAMPASGDLDASTDASTAELIDAGMDGTTVRLTFDADTDQDGEATDAAHASDSGDSGVVPVVACEPADLQRWRSFQVSGLQILTTNDCYTSNSACLAGPCDVAPCLRNAAGVGSCQTCISNEVSCITAMCQVQCAKPDVLDSCRKCACDNGCMGQATGCGLNPIDICVDCLGAHCTEVTPDPSLVLQVFNYGTILAPAGL
jgi:hypothetical protein